MRRAVLLPLTTLLQHLLLPLSGQAQKPEFKCISCMSTVAQKHWYPLSFYYAQPSSFTDACKHDAMALGVVPCDQACITLNFRLRVFGIETDQLTIRGCSSSLFRRSGYHPSSIASTSSLSSTSSRASSSGASIRLRPATIVYMTHVPSACRQRRMSDLFYNVPAAHDVLVELCTCLGQRCNGRRPVPPSDGRSTGYWLWHNGWHSLGYWWILVGCTLVAVCLCACYSCAHVSS